MYTEKLKQAEELFFHTDLNKSEIADALGISRRILHYWVRDNDWARLKNAAHHMPMMLTENIYYAMNKLLESVLSENRMMQPITKQEADTLHRLTLTINKLGKRTAVNESMEVLSHFMEDVAGKDPQLSERIAPFVKSYIQSGVKTKPYHFTPAKFNDLGCIPVPSDELDEEQKLDLADIIAWTEQPPVAPQQQPVPSHLKSNLTQSHSSLSLAEEAEDTSGRIPPSKGAGECPAQQEHHAGQIDTTLTSEQATSPSKKGSEKSKPQHPHLNRKQRRALARQNKLKQAA